MATERLADEGDGLVTESFDHCYGVGDVRRTRYVRGFPFASTVTTLVERQHTTAVSQCVRRRVPLPCLPG